MLFCETYQSTNLDSLKLLSFYFTIFVTRDNFFSVGFFWEDYLLLFERGRFQNCLIWSLEMTFNYNNLHYHVMNRAKILAPATNTKAEMKCLRSQNALDNLVMTNDWG